VDSDIIRINLVLLFFYGFTKYAAKLQKIFDIRK